MRGRWNRDTERGRKFGPCPHAYRLCAQIERWHDIEKVEGEEFALASRGIPEIEGTVLGSALLGDWLRCMEHREHHGQDGQRILGAPSQKG